MLHVLFSVYLKMLVLYSPFFVLSCFISLTRGYSRKEQRRLAWKVAIATLVSSVLLYLFGRVIFSVFGITVDAFRIGAGSVLFISALGMAQGKSAVQTDNVQQDVTIVPLTIPLTVGPGTIGALLVMGVSQPHWDDKLTAILSIVLASFTVGVVLYLYNPFDASVMAPVIDKWCAALQKHSHALWVVYVNPTELALFEKNGNFKPVSVGGGTAIFSR